MHYSVLLVLTTATTGLVTATPITPRAEIFKFTSGLKWDMILDKSKVTLDQLKTAPGTVIDIDLLDVIDANPPTSHISELSKVGKKVICYFSAGSREDWRADAKNYATSDYGAPLDPEWEGENWVDVKSTNVRAIVEQRIQRAAEAGCHAVDPDNVDGYNNNQDGFNYPRSEYVNFIKFMAGVAHKNNIAIGLKNGQAMIPDVLGDMDFAVNEQCHEYNECPAYEPVTLANKAVFHVEYETRNCTNPPNVVLSSLFKPLQLDTIGGQC